MTSPIRRHKHGRLRTGFVTAITILVTLFSGCGTNVARSTEERQILVLWHTFTGTEATALETLTDQFNAENPWHYVLVTEYQDDLLNKLQTAPESRPDLITLWPADLAAYVALGIVGAVPTESAELREAWADILPMAGTLYQANGVPQALPLGLATYLSYSNAEWLSDLGYSTGTATWDQFRSMACAATDTEEGQVGAGIPARASLFLAFLAASGSQIVSADGYYQFADAPGHNAAALLNEVISGGCGVIYEDRDEGMTRLSNSSMAVMMESSEYLTQIEQEVLSERNFELTISPLPGPDGLGPTLWFGPGLMISAPDAERQKAALNTLTWLFSTDAQQYWGATTRYLPIRRSVIESEIENAEQPTADSLTTDFWQLALDAADQGTWVAWPQATNRITCRASLLRGLLALQSPEADSAAYVDSAVTACNTGVEFKLTPTPEASPTPALLLEGKEGETTTP